MSTLDLNLDLHLEHLKIPTRNSGMSPAALCCEGDIVQHFMAVATSVPQFGQLTNGEPRNLVCAKSFLAMKL